MSFTNRTLTGDQNLFDVSSRLPLDGADHSFFTNHTLIGRPELIKISGALSNGTLSQS
jgi:hypothetical protein